MSIYAFPIPENNFSHNIVFYKEAFTKEQCEAIIQRMSGQEAQPGQVVRKADDALHAPDIRNVAIKFLQYEDFPEVYDKICQYVIDANDTHFKADIIGFMEDMQVLHYGEDIGGGHYNWHIDCGPGLSTRKLSVILQLSDPNDYTGCELEVSAVPNIPKEQGTLIIFPSYTPHRVTKLITGNRNSLVVWVNGPPYK
jgi:PKHD-type hydroxylase